MTKELKIKLHLYVPLTDNCELDEDETNDLAYSIIDKMIETDMSNLNSNILQEDISYQLYDIDTEYIESDEVYSNNNLSDKQLGELCWNFVYNDTDEYKTILEDDIPFIKSNTELIWDNIPNDKKNLIIEYIVNRNNNDEDAFYNVFDEIKSSVDRIVIDKLGYFYLGCNRWEKLSKLGNKIWYLAIKNNPIFKNISKVIEKSDKFEFYIENIARSLKEDNDPHYCKYEVYELLTMYMEKYSIENPSLCNEGSYIQLMKENEKLYFEMIIATNKMLQQYLSNTFEWNLNEFKWDLVTV